MIPTAAAAAARTYAGPIRTLVSPRDELAEKIIHRRDVHAPVRRDASQTTARRQGRFAVRRPASRAADVVVVEELVRAQRATKVAHGGGKEPAAGLIFGVADTSAPRGWEPKRRGDSNPHGARGFDDRLARVERASLCAAVAWRARASVEVSLVRDDERRDGKSAEPAEDVRGVWCSANGVDADGPVAMVRGRGGERGGGCDLARPLSESSRGTP